MSTSISLFTFRIGYYTAIATTILTIITFGIAILTPPLSGSFCTEGCFEYPYTSIASRFPRDYYWMYPAMLLSILYVMLMHSIHSTVQSERKVLSQIGVSISVMAAAVLVVDYFLQVSVIQPSLLKGETEGIAILSQYNPHGVFIALEDLSYLLMSISFLFVAFVFGKNSSLQKFIRWIFIACFVFVVLALVAISWVHGINREYYFEVSVITIVWLTLIVNGILLMKYFGRLLREN